MKMKCISFLLCLLAVVLCTGAVAKTTGADFSALIPSAPPGAGSGSNESEAGPCEHLHYGAYSFYGPAANFIDSEFAERNDIDIFDRVTGGYILVTDKCGVCVAYCPDCQKPSEGAFAGWIEHEMNGCSCVNCGYNSGKDHIYEDGVCSLCGKEYVEMQSFTFKVTDPNAQCIKGDSSVFANAEYTTGDIVTVEFEKGMTLAEFLSSEYADQIYGFLIYDNGNGTHSSNPNALLIGNMAWSVHDGSIYRYGTVVMSGDTVLEAKFYDFEAMAEEAA